jgi:hypothetical protein
MAGSRGEALMEVDMEGPVAMEPIEVSGKLFHFNKGAAFFSFHRDGSQGEQICLFRPNKIIIDKQKLGASNFKSVDAIAKVMKVGDPLGGLVVPHSASKPYVINDPSCDASEITPGWYAQAVWKGEKPTDVCAALRPGGNQMKQEEKELVIDNVPGKIVHNKLLAGPCSGKKVGCWLVEN